MAKIKSRLTVAFPVIIIVTVLSIGITAGGYYFILSEASNIERNEKYISEIKNIQDYILQKQEIASDIVHNFSLAPENDFGKVHAQADEAIQKLMGYSTNLSEDDVQSLKNLKSLNDSTLETYEKELITALAGADKKSLEYIYKRRKESYEKVDLLEEELRVSVEERILSDINGIKERIRGLESSINERNSLLEEVVFQLKEIEKQLLEGADAESRAVPGKNDARDTEIESTGKTVESVREGLDMEKDREPGKASQKVHEGEAEINGPGAEENVISGDYKAAEQVRLIISTVNNLSAGMESGRELLNEKAVENMEKGLAALGQVKRLAALTDERCSYPAEALISGSQEFDEYNKLGEALNQCFQQLEILLSSSEKSTLDEIKALVEAADAEYNELLTAIANINKGMVDSAFEKLKNELAQCISIAKALENSLDKYLAEDFDTSERIKTGILTALFVITLISVVLGFVLATALSGVNKSIKGMIDNLERVRRGDLKARVPVTGEDEIGELGSRVNNVLEEHQAITCRIRETADDISELKNKLAESFKSGKNNAKYISEELSEFFKNLKRGIKLPDVQKFDEAFELKPENIKLAASSAVNDGMKVLEIAEKEKQSASEAEEIITRVANTVKSLTDSINQLSESSGRIGDITYKITEIASKTNLLALNAAIEAAKAGNEGQGFTVVAEEIRKLSLASNKAAQEIKEQIADIQDKIREAADNIGSGFVEFEESAGIVGNVKAGIHEIIKSVQAVVKSVETVAETAGMQSKSASEMAKILNTIEEVAADAAGKGEYISRSIEEQNQIILGLEELTYSLDQTAARLNELLEKYNVD